MESPAMFSPTLHAQRRASSIKKPSFIYEYYLLLKTHYFLFFSAFGILYPILNITLRSRGLTDWEISLANVIIPFLVFFTNPLFGFIADRTGRYLATFNCVFALATILYGILFVLPKIQTNRIEGTLALDMKSDRILDFCAPQDVVTICASRSKCGCSYRAICTTMNPSKEQVNRFAFKFLMNTQFIDGQDGDSCGSYYRVLVEESMRNQSLRSRFKNHPPGPIANCDLTCSIPHFCQGSRKINQFGYVFLYSILLIAGNNFLSNAIPLGASIGIATLENSNIFGNQRVFGTVGFGVSAYLASVVYKLFENEYVYIIMFSITTIICLIVTSLIPIRNDEQSIEDNNAEDLTKEEQSKLSALAPLLKKVDVIVFLLLTFLWGMPYAGLDPYLYLYVDEIAPCSSREIIGYMSLSSACSEIIGFFVADAVLKLLGTNVASVVILLAFAVRFAGYYWITMPYVLTVMETMHFFNFGVLYVLIVQKANSIAPAGLSGTLQGVALGITFGLGRGVGLIISSLIYSSYGKRELFLITAIFNLIAAILFSIYFIVQHARKQPKKRKHEIENDKMKTNEEFLLRVPDVNEQ